MAGYSIFVVIGYLIRNYCLPNPFEVFNDGFKIGNLVLNPFILNIIAEPPLHLISFVEVGMIYRSGDAPMIGSILYLFAYCVNIAVLMLASVFKLRWYTNLLIIVVYLLIICVIVKVINNDV